MSPSTFWIGFSRTPLGKGCSSSFLVLLEIPFSPNSIPSRNSKPRNRPSFRQILLHLDIASADVLSTPQETYFKSQVCCGWENEHLSSHGLRRCPLRGGWEGLIGIEKMSSWRAETQSRATVCLLTSGVTSQRLATHSLQQCRHRQGLLQVCWVKA